MSIPSHFGRYRVVAHLATGGMAQVFIAQLEGPGQFQRTVAVKRVLPHLVEDARFREMFLDEARVSAAIHHSAVAEVYDLVNDGEVYLVMEYVPGETVLRLARVLRRRQRSLPWQLAAYIIARASAGLHAAHTLRVGSVPQPVVHRDVSPHNILVSYDGDVKIIDFGIAKMRGQEGRTQAGEIKGKFAYMSPEQARSQELDPRTDVFSLGIVLWELLTGRRLFGREDEVGTLQAVLHEEVAAPSTLTPDLPEELDDIVLMALSREREERQESADELRRQLESVLTAHDATDGREALQALMTEQFAERAATKELLIHGEFSEGHVPSLATPNVTEISVVSTERAHRQPGTAGGDGAAARRVAWPWWAGATLTVVGLVSWVGMARPDPDAEVAPSEPVTAAPPNVSAEPRTLELSAPEREAEAPAILELTSTPSGAEVFLDGAFLGLTPLHYRHTGGREGTLRLRLDGHRTIEAPVALIAGETTRIERALRPAPRRVEAERTGSTRSAPRRRPQVRERPPTPEPSPGPAPAAAPRPDYFRFD